MSDAIPILTAPLLLITQEAAGLCALHPKTMLQRGAAKQIPGMRRIGRAVRWDRQALEQWIADGCPESPTSRRRKQSG
jgi:predicted DNA-binding transcriptional regulator AlpA